MSEDVKPKPDPLAFYCYEPTEAEERQTLDVLCEKMRGVDLVDQYRSTHKKPFKPDTSSGYATLPVLQQFWGKKLCNSVVAYLQALRPSSVRITSGEVTCDSVLWRVTIYTDRIVGGTEIITRIEQEVSVGFGSGYNVEQVFNHLHEGKPKPKPCPRVIGNLAALAKAKFD